MAGAETHGSHLAARTFCEANDAFSEFSIN